MKLGWWPSMALLATRYLSSCPHLSTQPSRDVYKRQDYYWAGLRPWLKAKPNAAHLALTQAGAFIITQNIDGLHQAAGSPHVIELHGNLRELVCEHCGTLYPAEQWEAAAAVPLCPVDQHILKPNVVLFEETPHGFDEALEQLAEADWLLVVGTSLQVAPACYLPQFAQMCIRDRSGCGHRGSGAQSASD